MCQIDFIPPKNVFIFCQHSDISIYVHTFDLRNFQIQKDVLCYFGYMYYISLECDHHYAFVEILTMQEGAF